MTNRFGFIHGLKTAAVALLALSPFALPAAPVRWESAGWGGGGCFWAVAFHPTREGVIYMGGDVAGAYKTEDFGKNWRFINNGLHGNAVYAMAVDAKSPETVYASTTLGLAKSTDGGANWRPVPNTGPKELGITGERGKSIHPVAVDPTDSAVVYAGTPSGKIYKSTDGAQTWRAVHGSGASAEDDGAVPLQFGKVNNATGGGMWVNNPVPKGVKPEDCAGFGFSAKIGEGRPPQLYFQVKTAAGAVYRSREVGALLASDEWRDVVLRPGDFTVDPDFAKKNAGQPAPSLAPGDFAGLKQVSFLAAGLTSGEMSVVKVKRLFVVAPSPSGGDPRLQTVKDFSSAKKVDGSHGNARSGGTAGGAVFSVAVSPRNPARVFAATQSDGLLFSDDAGATWTKLPTPSRASHVAIHAGDDRILYGAFHSSGLMKSADGGKSWAACTPPGAAKFNIVDVAVSATDPARVYCIGTLNYDGKVFASADGGKTWTENSRVKPNYADNPTLPLVHGKDGLTGLSRVQNLAVSPLNFDHLYVAADWRPAFSGDGGRTLEERVRGADISCVADLKFHKGRAYVAVMDEGVLMSDNNGRDWRQLWPRAYDANISGHAWQVAVIEEKGTERILATGSPWNKKVKNNVVVISEDGGKTYRHTEAGLPDYLPKANTMWGQGYMRALAVDPRDPRIIYAGIDGDPEAGKSGGGVFKSEDGGHTWKQLPNQPGSRRMFYALAVDPSDSKRIYWGAVGAGGGLYRSDDGGGSWTHVFKHDASVFNVVVTPDGTVYCPGKNLWKSTDHGKTWKKISDFSVGKAVVGLAVHPRDPKTIWVSSITWGEGTEGAIYKTTDGGVSWQDITGDIPRRNPLILRFNPETNELWAAGVGIYKTAQ